MDKNKRSLSEIYYLSNLILNKILKDKKIRGKLYTLVKDGSITKDSVLLFSAGERVIKELLGEIVTPDKKGPCNLSIVNKDARKMKKTSKKHPKEQIDGRELTENEVSFQEWTIEQFNEKEWLKKNHLKF